MAGQVKFGLTKFRLLSDSNFYICYGTVSKVHTVAGLFLITRGVYVPLLIVITLKIR